MKPQVFDFFPYIFLFWQIASHSYFNNKKMQCRGAQRKKKISTSMNPFIKGKKQHLNISAPKAKYKRHGKIKKHRSENRELHLALLIFFRFAIFEAKKNEEKKCLGCLM